jgi:formylglycine-generating enzyme required for sulfatase activity
MHLTGSVWEWQRSIYQDYPYMPDDGREKMSNNDDDVVDESYVLRGGSFFNPANRLRSANRYARQLSEGGNLNIRFPLCPSSLVVPYFPHLREQGS